MAKFSHLKDEILEYIKNNPDESTDKLAAKFTEPKEVANLARQIRDWKRFNGLKTKIKPAKILLFDIETAPMTCYAWSKYQTPISDNQIIKDWFIISWSAKWLFDDGIISERITPKEIKKGDDQRITKKLWKLLDNANIVIAHNLKGFDKKKANTRFLKYELGLPSQYLEIDTLLVARKNFKVSSNRLDYLANFLGVEGKLETTTGLWNRCMEGDEQAINDMVTYCEQDVRVLEDVYLKLRPYITNHPNVNLFIGSHEASCKACSSTNMQYDGEYMTTMNIYEAYRCGDCGLQHRSRKNITEKGLRDSLLR